MRALYDLTDRLYRSRSVEDVYEAALDAITATLRCDRASVLMFDEAGVMRFVAWRGLSDGYRATLEGHSPWTKDEEEPEPIFVPDIEQAGESEKVVSVIRGENIRSLGFIPLNLRGKVVGKFMAYYADHHEFTAHEIVLATTIARHLGFGIERTRAEEARREALAELKLSEERFRLMSETAPVMIWMSDANGACLHLNRMLRDFWGVPEDAVASFDWRDSLHPDDCDTVLGAMMEAVQNRACVSVKGRYRSASGEYRILKTDAVPRLSSLGEFLGMIGVNDDVTERERHEAQREVLFAELNHRVKNTLMVVQAIAHQTFKASENDEAVQAFLSRLSGLSIAHSMLTRQNWENSPLSQLARDALAAQGANLNRIRIKGPEVMLPPKQALAITMALHELHTNALKHGALSIDSGRVDLEWSGGEDGNLLLVWRESDGPEVRPRGRRGFGSLLIESILPSDLGGSVDLAFRPDGVVCRIETSLAAVA